MLYAVVDGITTVYRGRGNVYVSGRIVVLVVNVFRGNAQWKKPSQYTASRMRVLVTPDRGSQRFADTETYGNGDAYHQYNDEDFHQDPVASAKPLHECTSTVLLAGLGSLLPITLVRPDLTILLASEDDTTARFVHRGGHHHGFDISFEWIAVVGPCSRTARCSLQGGHSDRWPFRSWIGDSEVCICQRIALDLFLLWNHGRGCLVMLVSRRSKGRLLLWWLYPQQQRQQAVNFRGCRGRRS